VTEYERSRIRLLVALGIPAQELFCTESPGVPAPAEHQRSEWTPAGP
jgi:hypothetical protein